MSDDEYKAKTDNWDNPKYYRILHKLKRKKLYERLTQLAEEGGFEHVGALLVHLYYEKDLSLKQLAKTLFIPLGETKRLLFEHKIKRKKPGGHNNSSVVITPATLAQAARDGVRATAISLGIDPMTLGRLLREKYGFKPAPQPRPKKEDSNG